MQYSQSITCRDYRKETMKKYNNNARIRNTYPWTSVVIHETIVIMAKIPFHVLASRNFSFFFFSSIFVHWLHKLLRYTTSTTFSDSTTVAATRLSHAMQPLLLQEQQTGSLYNLFPLVLHQNSLRCLPHLSIFPSLWMRHHKVFAWALFPWLSG